MERESKGGIEQYQKVTRWEVLHRIQYHVDGYTELDPQFLQMLLTVVSTEKRRIQKDP